MKIHKLKGRTYPFVFSVQLYVVFVDSNRLLTSRIGYGEVLKILKYIKKFC
jgi:hypothetical protein